MPYQMSYLDATGTTNGSSHWVATVITLDYANSRAGLLFQGYKDAGSYNSGKAAVGAKGYTVTGSTFTTYFSLSALGSATPSAKAYAYAAATLDTGGVSFFNAAAAVDTSGNSAVNP